MDMKMDMDWNKLTAKELTEFIQKHLPEVPSSNCTKELANSLFKKIPNIHVNDLTDPVLGLYIASTYKGHRSPEKYKLTDLLSMSDDMILIFLKLFCIISEDRPETKRLLVIKILKFLDLVVDNRGTGKKANIVTLDFPENWKAGQDTFILKKLNSDKLNWEQELELNLRLSKTILKQQKVNNGDLIKDKEGKLRITDGQTIFELDDNFGIQPKNFCFPDYPIDYWFGLVNQTIFWINIELFREELLQNLREGIQNWLGEELEWRTYFCYNGKKYNFYVLAYKKEEAENQIKNSDGCVAYVKENPYFEIIPD